MRDGVLTFRQGQMWSVLDNEWRTTSELTNRAELRTASPRETAAKYLAQLVREGLAEKGGTRMFPTWRKRP